MRFQMEPITKVPEEEGSGTVASSRILQGSLSESEVYKFNLTQGRTLQKHLNTTLNMVLAVLLAVVCCLLIHHLYSRQEKQADVELER